MHMSYCNAASDSSFVSKTISACSNQSIVLLALDFAILLAYCLHSRDEAATLAFANFFNLGIQGGVCNNLNKSFDRQASVYNPDVCDPIFPRKRNHAF